ncbi:MAG: isoprenyl transferase [Oscillospiraceae bacterium]|jgi:undecaprenyl diphosphate synthase|nr:isoprenyl transferase [Oscillospiraceae bacterium]
MSLEKFDIKSNKNKNLPKHLAIIMDGNGRWAKKKLLPRSVGHKFGAKNFRSITRYCNSIGILYLTVFAFSTENWKRPKEEIKFLIVLFKQYLKEALKDFKKENVKIKFLGERNVFPKEVISLINEAEKISLNSTSMFLNIAMNYGSRSEITRAVRLIAKEVAKEKININDINESIVSDNLYTFSQPDVDLVLRTGGEKRISNFLLWQSAYAEYIFSDVLWPDFKPQDLQLALAEFSLRKRRFGGVTVDN